MTGHRVAELAWRTLHRIRRGHPYYSSFVGFDRHNPCARCAALLDSDKPGLDEERLAKAIWLVQHHTAADHYDRYVPPGSPHRAEVDELGEQVAAEYARLTDAER